MIEGGKEPQVCMAMREGSLRCPFQGNQIPRKKKRGETLGTGIEVRKKKNKGGGPPHSKRKEKGDYSEHCEERTKANLLISKENNNNYERGIGKDRFTWGRGGKGGGAEKGGPKERRPYNSLGWKEALFMIYYLGRFPNPDRKGGKKAWFDYGDRRESGEEGPGQKCGFAGGEEWFSTKNQVQGSEPKSWGNFNKEGMSSFSPEKEGMNRKNWKGLNMQSGFEGKKTRKGQKCRKSVPFKRPTWPEGMNSSWGAEKNGFLGKGKKKYLLCFSERESAFLEEEKIEDRGLGGQCRFRGSRGRGNFSFSFGQKSSLSFTFMYLHFQRKMRGAGAQK